jgi:hypothetical protein
LALFSWVGGWFLDLFEIGLTTPIQDLTQTEVNHTDIKSDIDSDIESNLAANKSVDIDQQ